MSSQPTSAVKRDCKHPWTRDPRAEVRYLDLGCPFTCEHFEPCAWYPPYGGEK